MDWYHSWIYVNIVNTKWMMLSIAVIIFFLNLIGPFLVWFVSNGKSIPIVKNIKKKKKEKAVQN